MADKKAKYKYHPALEYIPRMLAAEKTELGEDIAKNGLDQEIELWKEFIIDGRERYEECEARGIEPRFKEYMGDDPIGKIISLNLMRRHLDKGQLAGIAAGLGNLKRGQKKQIGSTTDLKQEDLAERFKISTKLVGDAATVKEKDPALFKQILSGETTPTAAARQVRKREREAAAADGSGNQTQEEGKPTEEENALFVELSSDDLDLHSIAYSIERNWKKRNHKHTNLAIQYLRTAADKLDSQQITKRIRALATKLEREMPPEKSMTEEQGLAQVGMTAERYAQLKSDMTKDHYISSPPGKRFTETYIAKLKAANAKFEEAEPKKAKTTALKPAANKKKEKTEKKTPAAEADTPGSDTITTGNDWPGADSATVGGDTVTLGGSASVTINGTVQDQLAIGSDAKAAATPPAIEPEPVADPDSDDDVTNRPAEWTDSRLTTTEGAATRVSELLDGKPVTANDLMAMIERDLIDEPQHIDKDDKLHCGFRWSDDEILNAAEKWPEYKHELSGLGRESK